MFRSGSRVVMLLLACLVVLGSLSLPVAALTQGDTQTTPGPVAFISGSTRIVVYQTQVVGNEADYGLPVPAETAGTVWVVSILDVTNFGTVPTTLSLGAFQLLHRGNPVTADLSQGPSAKLGFTDVQPDGSVAIPVDATIRMAVAFAVPGEALANGSTFQREPALKFGDEQVNLSSTVVESLDPSPLPPVQPWIGSQGAVQNVTGNGTLEVNVAGTLQTVKLAGVTTPPVDGCFGAESSAAISTLSSGSVWIEDDPNSEGALVWYWDAARGHLALMNQALVEQGFGVSDNESDGTRYAAWLAAKTEAVEASKTGLWSTCKGAGGEWINPPVAAAAPTEVPVEAPATTLMSGGLGLSQAEWEAQHGEGKEVEGVFGLAYEGRTYEVVGPPEANIIRMAVNFTGDGVPTDSARSLVQRVLPHDAQLIEQYTAPTGSPVDRYYSDWLATRADPGSFVGGVPGEFIVIYRDGDQDGKTNRVLIALGNNP